ncbi:MAG: DNA translocase FtsK [Eubacteriales bacterium]|nr:DNA translocase FtsK [Eubacteriales bacterium]
MSNKTGKTTKGKTTVKSRKPAGKAPRINDRLLNEVKGVVYIVIAILFFVSRRYESGLIFGYLTRFLKVLSGKGYILVPYLFLVIGLLYFVNYMKQQKASNVKFALVIFICIISILTITDATVMASSIFSVRDLRTVADYFVKGSLESQISGGGIIGGVVSYILVFLLGRVGSLIVNGAVILICLILITQKSAYLMSSTFINRVKVFFQTLFKSIYEFVFIEDRNDKKQKKKATVGKEPETSHMRDYSYNDYNIKGEVNKQRVFDMDLSSGKTSEPIRTNELRTKKDDVAVHYTRVEKPEKTTKLKDEAFEEVKLKANMQAKNDAYRLPDISLLDDNVKNNITNEKREAIESADILLKTLKSFGIDCKLVQINRGPTITRYELQPAPGVKVSRITNLSKDIALNLAKSDVRIEAPIPGKAAVGIEVPNENKSDVFLKELIVSKEYKDDTISIPFAIGKDIAGKNMVADIASMPHLLIAGATGSGKSVCINALLMSILFRAKPDDIKLILIDPKVVELNIYNGLPHLLIPVVTDPRKAANALGWAVQEMSNRYDIFAQNSVRDITSYNNKKLIENKKEEIIPKIVIVIDELADLMMVAAGEVEDSITRLAQLARAAGIHLVIATQRPSVDVITGTIKANISARIAFSVSSYIDSRTILDSSGAEKLLGKGDLLYHPVGTNKHIRIQGVFVSDEEVRRIIAFIKNQKFTAEDNEVEEEIINVQINKDNDYDEYLQRAAELVVMEGQASVSYMQRKLKVGYSRAARIIDQLEEIGIVGPHEGSKPRKVLMDAAELEEINF